MVDKCVNTCLLGFLVQGIWDDGLWNTCATIIICVYVHDFVIRFALCTCNIVSVRMLNFTRFIFKSLLYVNYYAIICSSVYKSGFCSKLHVAMICRSHKPMCTMAIVGRDNWLLHFDISLLK